MEDAKLFLTNDCTGNFASLMRGRLNLMASGWTASPLVTLEKLLRLLIKLAPNTLGMSNQWKIATKTMESNPVNFTQKYMSNNASGIVPVFLQLWAFAIQALEACRSIVPVIIFVDAWMAFVYIEKTTTLDIRDPHANSHGTRHLIHPFLQTMPDPQTNLYWCIIETSTVSSKVATLTWNELVVDRHTWTRAVIVEWKCMLVGQGLRWRERRLDSREECKGRPLSLKKEKNRDLINIFRGERTDMTHLILEHHLLKFISSSQ